MSKRAAHGCCQHKNTLPRHLMHQRQANPQKDKWHIRRCGSPTPGCVTRNKISQNLQQNIVNDYHTTTLSCIASLYIAELLIFRERPFSILAVVQGCGSGLWGLCGLWGLWVRGIGAPRTSRRQLVHHRRAMRFARHRHRW